VPADRDDHEAMTAPDPPSTPPAGGNTPDGAAPEKKHRSPWMWVSIGLAVIAAGLLIWALNTNSDLNSTQEDVDDLQSQVDQGQETGSTFVAAAKTAIADLTSQLGATSDDLANAEQDVNDAQQTADQAQKDADAAKDSAAKANDKTEKAQAETDQAKAEAKAAESKATIAADCAKAYTSAIGTLFEGDDVRARAAQVSEQLRGITDQCKAALGGT
jgi:uncharacterized membrane-anchored protein YhcB (DUF1043 family)